MPTILIADSGSTKTDWLLVNEDGEVIKAWNTQGINPFFQKYETVSNLITEEVFPEIITTPDKIFFYGAGCVNREAGKPIIDSFEKKFGDVLIEVESDLLGAARSLCQHEPGIACILGTGSNNCSYDGNGITGNIGSLGFWMGDEGSGGHLGKQLVIGYLHRELPAGLMVAFEQKYPEVNRLEILDRAYKQPFPNRYFARYTHFIYEHRTDPYLAAILSSSFDTFLEKYVVKHPQATRFPVSFVGSVAWYFKEILTQTISSKGLHEGIIVRTPMEGLKQFHTLKRQS